MPLRKPGVDETQEEWMRYCMRELSDADTARPQDQKVAICLRAWRGGQKEKFAELIGKATKLIKGALR